MTTSGWLQPRSIEDTKALMKVALGEEKADLAVVNAKLLNVYTGELLDDCAISIKAKWIAYVGNRPKYTIGPQTDVIDAGGKTVIPGLIDGHAHIAWLYAADEFLKYVIKGGTTTIVTETMEPYPVAGCDGLVEYLESLQDQPVKILANAPAMVSISRAARGISQADLQRLLARSDVIALGESYWQAVLQDPDQLLPLFEQTLSAGKTLQGHSAGATEKKLSAYAAAGITSCHEPINVQQVLDRLRMGFHIMIREGSIRRDLEEIAKIKDEGIDLRRLVLVTDGASPADLMEKGYMEHVVQKAIDCGFDPIAAIRMATLNTAEHFSLDSRIGGIAPGRFADLLLIPDLRTIEAQTVVSNGRVVFQDGKLLISPRQHRFSEKSLNSVHLPGKLNASDFVITARRNREQARVRVINMLTDLVTTEEVLDWPVVDGQLRSDPEQGVIKIAAIDRTHNPGKTFTGLIKGFGLKSGALACSASWDASDIIVVGADETDMALAVNRIHALQGGAVIYNHGDILAELPMPVFGIISQLPMETIARRLEEMTKIIAALGVTFPDPLLTLITLSGSAIPYLKICEEGLVNLKDGKTRGLYV